MMRSQNTVTYLEITTTLPTVGGSVDGIIRFYGDNNEQFSKYNGIKY
jgi:hypothetical protein